MAKDIYLSSGNISSSLLSSSKSYIDDLVASLSSLSAMSNASYRDAVGSHSLYSSGITAEAASLLRKANSLSDKLERYSSIMNTGPDELFDVDNGFKNELTTWWARTSYSATDFIAKTIPMGPSMILDFFKNYDEHKESIGEFLQENWNKITGYDLPSRVFKDFLDDVLLEPLDFINTMFSSFDMLIEVIEKASRGEFDIDFFNNLYDVFSKPVNEILDSPLSGAKLKAISEALKATDKYSKIQSEYEEICVQKILAGDYLSIPVYLFQSLVIFTKALTDTSVQVIDSVFMLGEVGTALSMITGYDIPGKLDDWGTAISDYVDQLFAM